MPNKTHGMLLLHHCHYIPSTWPPLSSWTDCGVCFVRRSEEETGCTDVGVICQKHPDVQFIFPGEKINKSLKKTRWIIVWYSPACGMRWQVPFLLSAAAADRQTDGRTADHFLAIKAQRRRCFWPSPAVTCPASPCQSWNEGLFIWALAERRRLLLRSYLFPPHDLKSYYAFKKKKKKKKKWITVHTLLSTRHKYKYI